MEFLQANWLWLLLGLGALWFLFGRGGMGCGTRGHGSHGSGEPKDDQERVQSHASHTGNGDGRPQEQEKKTAAHRGHGGC